MFEEYCWREKRAYISRMNIFPVFINTRCTTLPTGNAHYSMYGITERDSKIYEKMYKRQHEIFEHYSDELIIDAETPRAAQRVENICLENDWSFHSYDTGSGAGGAHIHILREAEPSELLYLRDKMFVEKHFEDVPDLDLGIYHPMHLIRGIGKYHEETNNKKQKVRHNIGTKKPNVMGEELYQLALERHNRIKKDYKFTETTNWSKLQNTLLRHSPDGIRAGKRYASLWPLCKDLIKCGLDEPIVKYIAEKFSEQFEVPPDDPTAAVEKAFNDAKRSVERQ